VADGDAVIKHVAFALPSAFAFWHFFKIFEDTAFQVVHFFKPFLRQPCGEFFAAYTAGAECGYLAVPGRAEVLAHELRQFLERAHARVNRPGKRAKVHLVIIARVNDNGFGIVKQRVPFLGIYVFSAMFKRYRFADGNSFFFQPYLGKSEGLAIARTFLVLEIRLDDIIPQVRQYFVNGGARPGDSAVDALRRDKQRSFDGKPLQFVKQRETRFLEVWKIEKVIERCDDELHT